MDFRDIVELALEECKRDLYRALDGLNREELTWQPGPESNPIGFLVWHVARVEDSWVQRFCQQKPQIWERDGWHTRLGLPQDATGNSYTPEQVRAFPMPDIAQVKAYYDAVRAETLAYIKGLTAADLATSRQTPRGTSRTIAQALSHLVVEESQHMGQTAYLRGLKRGSNK